MDKKLKVLAVADPAIYAYTDSKYALIEKFNQQFSAEVEFSIIPWNEYYETMMQTFSGKYDYDIVMVAGHLWLKDFVNKGYLAEVNPPEEAEYNRKDILPVIAKEMRINDKAFLYPSFCDGHILLYRKSHVEDIIGKAIPKIVTTDMILEIASKCNGVNGMKGIALKAHQSEIFLDFLPYLRNEGIDAFDDKSHAPTFNNDKGRQALEKYLSLKAYAPEETHLYGNEEVREAFQQKKVALAVTWGGQLGVVLSEDCQELSDVGFAAVHSAWNVTWSFAISSKSQRQDLANNFLAYLTSKEVDRIIGSFAGAPVRKSTYVADSAKYNWYDTHLQLLDYAKPLPMMDYAGEKMEPLYEHIYHAFIGKQRVTEALAEAENKIEQIDLRRN